MRLPLQPRSVTSPFRSFRWVSFLTPLAFFLAGTSLPAADPQPNATGSLILKTAGSLVVAGGGKLSDSIRDRFLELAGGAQARLVVIPTASGRIDKGEVSPSYLFWRSQPVSSVDLLHTRDRKRADDPQFVEPLARATGVWFTGGDQSRLAAAYQGTAVLRELRKVMERGGVIGGTSAGAAVMSSVMITGGTKEAETDTGFGLVPGMVVDQHFSNRKRMDRLMGVLLRHPEMLGLGIDEQTAAVFKGSSLSIVGDAHVWVCMPSTATLPVNVQRLKHGEQINLSDLSRTFYARGKTSPDKAVLTSASKTQESEPTMSVKGR